MGKNVDYFRKMTYNKLVKKFSLGGGFIMYTKKKITHQRYKEGNSQIYSAALANEKISKYIGVPKTRSPTNLTYKKETDVKSMDSIKSSTNEKDSSLRKVGEISSETGKVEVGFDTKTKKFRMFFSKKREFNDQNKHVYENRPTYHRGHWDDKFYSNSNSFTKAAVSFEGGQDENYLKIFQQFDKLHDEKGKTKVNAALPFYDTSYEKEESSRLADLQKQSNDKSNIQGAIGFFDYLKSQKGMKKLEFSKILTKVFEDIKEADKLGENDKAYVWNFEKTLSMLSQFKKIDISKLPEVLRKYTNLISWLESFKNVADQAEGFGDGNGDEWFLYVKKLWEFFDLLTWGDVDANALDNLLSLDFWSESEKAFMKSLVMKVNVEQSSKNLKTSDEVVTWYALKMKMILESIKENNITDDELKRIIDMLDASEKNNSIAAMLRLIRSIDVISIPREKVDQYVTYASEVVSLLDKTRAIDEKTINLDQAIEDAFKIGNKEVLEVLKSFKMIVESMKVVGKK